RRARARGGAADRRAGGLARGAPRRAPRPRGRAAGRGGRGPPRLARGWAALMAGTGMLSGTQKAALLLIQLGREPAARIMAQLDEAEIEELTAEIARLERVDPATAQAVLDEFYQESLGAVGHGGIGFAQQVLEASLGRDRAQSVLERLATSLAGQPFEFLQYADARQVVSLLAGEHPQTIALVLAHLRPDHASAIITGLPPAVAGDVAHRIALMERAAPDVVAVVAENLQRKASAVLSTQEMAAVG